MQKDFKNKSLNIDFRNKAINQKDLIIKPMNRRT